MLAAILNLISDTTLIEGPFQQDKAHWVANDDIKKMTERVRQ